MNFWLFGALDPIPLVKQIAEANNHFIWHALRLFYWSARNQSAFYLHLLWLPLFTITRFQFIAHCTVILLQFIKCNAFFVVFFSSLNSVSSQIDPFRSMVHVTHTHNSMEICVEFLLLFFRRSLMPHFSRNSKQTPSTICEQCFFFC